MITSFMKTRLLTKKQVVLREIIFYLKIIKEKFNQII